MSPPRPPRDRQRGNSLLLALIVMSALAALGVLTVISMQSSLKTSTNDRAQEIALYAAESGAAVAMDFLRANFSVANGWSNYVTPSNNNVVPVPVALIPSNGVPARQAGNLFTNDQSAAYSIRLFNNRDDPNFAAAANNDADARIIIRVTGGGPQGAVAILEWEVQRVGLWIERPTSPAPPTLPPGQPVFAQFQFLDPANPEAPLPPFPWPNAPPTPAATPAPPGALPPLAGMVLLSWHIVSL
jgi:type II secretory pathway pseudopilin PulG